MHKLVEDLPAFTFGYAGLRMTADEYFALPDDGNKYELLDGVVVMSPSATPMHQRVAGEVFNQLYNHVEPRSLGLLVYETDVHLGKGPTGRDLVYRPEIVFFSRQRLANVPNRLRLPPDLAIEVISPESGNYDRITKRADYERAGVTEYWIIDPEPRTLTFLRLDGGRYAGLSPASDRFESLAVSGFTLDVARLRKVMESLG
jgi:Uma2 family endonuclease